MGDAGQRWKFLEGWSRSQAQDGCQISRELGGPQCGTRHSLARVNRLPQDGSLLLLEDVSFWRACQGGVAGLQDAVPEGLSVRPHLPDLKRPA
ncbi:hypothetical protein DFAR_2690038 [Desulfarculales bacterium]